MNPLQALCDLPLVESAFAIDAEGRLVALVPHAFFTAAVLASAAERLRTFSLVVDDNFDSIDEVIFQFDRHVLYARRMNGVTVCAVTREQPSIGILRMAANAVAKSLAIRPAEKSAGPAAFAVTSTVPPPATGGPVKKKKGGGIWG
ncbi:MAG: hypothetical protein H7Z43_11640 [Clostridia bacterium]|nr:hypothetical protein [Deltaproteobacteria bacterium]